MSKLLDNKFIKSKPVQLSARTLDRFLSAGLRALDQGLSTVMDDLVNGKRSRKGARMARSVLKAAGAPQVRRLRATRPTRVVVRVYAGGRVNF
jgi:hypothetical protein